MTSKRVSLTLSCALLLAAPAAEATSVIPLALPELTQEADAIVRVRVLDADARWGTFLDERAIVTDLELAVVEVLKGRAPATLTVFGGTVGDQTLSLVGQPMLRAGDEAFLFLITREEVTCPFVGIWQGVYPIQDGQVFREGAPVVDVVDGELAFAEDHERGMSPTSFAREVRRLLETALRTDPIRAELPVGGARLEPTQDAPETPAVDAPVRLRLRPVHDHAHPHPVRGGAQ